MAEYAQQLNFVGLIICGVGALMLAGLKLRLGADPKRPDKIVEGESGVWTLGRDHAGYVLFVGFLLQFLAILP